MTQNATMAMEVARLAVVSKDFTTYYIPGHTMIHNKRVARIVAYPEHYDVMDIDGVILSDISKKLPILVDWRETAVPAEHIPLEEGMEALLVEFGNYIIKKIQADPEILEAAHLEVSHADIENWKSTLTNQNVKV